MFLQRSQFILFSMFPKEKRKKKNKEKNHNDIVSVRHSISHRVSLIEFEMFGARILTFAAIILFGIFFFLPRAWLSFQFVFFYPRCSSLLKEFFSKCVKNKKKKSEWRERKKIKNGIDNSQMKENKTLNTWSWTILFNSRVSIHYVQCSIVLSNAISFFFFFFYALTSFGWNTMRSATSIWTHSSLQHIMFR